MQHHPEDKWPQTSLEIHGFIKTLKVPDWRAGIGLISCMMAIGIQMKPNEREAFARTMDEAARWIRAGKFPPEGKLGGKY